MHFPTREVSVFATDSRLRGKAAYKKLIVAISIPGHRHILSQSALHFLSVQELHTIPAFALPTVVCCAPQSNIKVSHHARSELATPKSRHTTNNPALKVQLILQNIRDQAPALAGPSRAYFIIRAHNRRDICLHCFGEGPEVELQLSAFDFDHRHGKEENLMECSIINIRAHLIPIEFLFVAD